MFGASGYAVSLHNVSGAFVHGNHVEGAAGGVNASSSSAVRATGNTLAGLSGPAFLARDMRPADAAANATGILSDGLAAVLNDVHGTAVALRVEGAGPGPAGDAAASPPQVRLNYNTLHPHAGEAPAIESSAAGAAVDARSNYYPGLGSGTYPRVAGPAAASVLAHPAAAPPGGPLRIGVLLDAAASPYVDGPAAEAARAAADEANRRAAGHAFLRPVELVEAPVGGNGSGGPALPPASAARAIAAGAAADWRVMPVLLRSIGEAASWHAESPGAALERIAAAPYRGHVLFAADSSGTVLAASAAGPAPASAAGPAPASAAPGLPLPAAAADPAAFAAAVGRLSGGSGSGSEGNATVWLGHALPDGTVVRTLLAPAPGGGAAAVLGALYDAGPPPRAYVGPTSPAVLEAAAAALPPGTPIVSPAVVDGRAVASAGPSVFSMAPASAGSAAPVAGQVMSEERVAAVIPVVQADGYSLRFAAAALAEYAARSGGSGTVLNSVTFAPSEVSAAFWSGAADGMEAAAAGLARGGLGPHGVAVLYVGGGGPFEALAGQALARPALAGAQWYAGDAIAQAVQPGAQAAAGTGPPPWYAPGNGSGNATSAEALSRRTALMAFAFEPARGLGADPASSAAAASVLGEILLRQAASPARGGPPPAETLATAYAYLAHDAVLALAAAVPAAEAADPASPEYGAAIRQAAAAAAQFHPHPRPPGVVRGAAFDAGGSLSYPAPYALWVSAPSGPPARAGTMASPPAACGIALADARLDFGGVRPGGASGPQEQVVANAGTATLGSVAMNATDWAASAPAGPGGGSGTPPALASGLTEVAAGRPPPGAPPPSQQPGAFAPAGGDAAALGGLAPGNSARLQFVLNLTSVPGAPPMQVEQVVTYTASCG